MIEATNVVRQEIGHMESGADVVGVKIGTYNAAAEPAQQSLHQLPAPPADFTGREAELRELWAAIAAEGSGGAFIAGLRGLGGVGKTVLALVLANELRADYPDAQYLVDTRGLDEPPTVRAAMQQVVRGFVGPQAPMPDDQGQLASLYRSCLSGQ